VAVIYRAELRPTKLQLIADWLPTQSWYSGGAHPELTALGAYRFDDPDGAVGIETHLLRTDPGPVLQVPLTYRGAPLPAAEPWLVGTMEHSVLGRRWVYDACGDPVWALAAAVLGGHQAEEYVDGATEPRPPTAQVQGSGLSAATRPGTLADPDVSTDGPVTVVRASGWELVVPRVVDPAAATGEGHTLTGTWSGQDEPVLLATVRPG
jgi:hypothetical protein